MSRSLLPLCLSLFAACSPDPAPPKAPSAEAPLPSAAPAPAQTAHVRVAITVDDLPVHGPSFRGVDRGLIAERLIAAFARHRVPGATGFVNGKKVDDDPATEAIVRRWASAGNPLGNHTYSHPSLNKLALVDYLADVDKGEAILRKIEPNEASWRTFRYPFLFEGDTMDKRKGVRDHLAKRGYAIAEVTIDADDWAFNPPFARCSDKGDVAALAELRRDFVAAHVEELRRMRSLTRELMGREVPHVLLLHVGAADADAIDDLLTAYEREGAVWIELRAALADPFYTIDPALPVKWGWAFPYAVAKARGVTAPPPIFARDLEEKLGRVCK